MPISCDWHNEQTILVRFSGRWNWSDFNELRQTLLQELDAAPHPVICITDYSGTNSSPTGVIARLPAIAEVGQHPALAHFILVGIKTSIGKMAVRLYKQLYGGAHTAASLPKAYQLAETLIKEEQNAH